MKKQLIHSLGDSSNMGMLGSAGQFAHAYKLGNFVYMTGQTGFTLTGELVGAYDPAAQADDYARRAIDIREGEVPDSAAFKALIQAAVALNGTPKRKAAKA